jgi:hypothetical protein
VRSAAFFDWAGSAAALWTLLAWAVGGLVLVWLGRARMAPHGGAASTDAGVEPSPSMGVPA